MKRAIILLNLIVSLSLATPLVAAASVLPTPRLANAVSPTDSGGASCVTVGVKILRDKGNKVCGDTANGGVIYAYLRLIIIFLSGLVGLGVVLMLVWGGVQYIMSAGNPTNVAAAKSRIMNALTGLVLFILMYGILNFLIPGGILG